MQMASAQSVRFSAGRRRSRSALYGEVVRGIYVCQSHNIREGVEEEPHTQDIGRSRGQIDMLNLTTYVWREKVLVGMRGEVLCSLSWGEACTDNVIRPLRELSVLSITTIGGVNAC